ncbi:MAG: polysaccharide biosynthesis protein [Bacilli bacterium]|nr:polysaccharide biosynthesis protein [Bacilli bacterium]
MAYNRRLYSFMLLDAAIVAVSVWFVFSLRFDFSIPMRYLDLMPYAIFVNVMVHIACFHYYKVHNRIWQYTGIEEMMVILKASLVTLAGVVMIYSLVPLIVPSYRIPLSVYLAGIYVFLGIAGSRMAIRIVGEKAWKNKAAPSYANLLIVGAGKAGIIVAKEIRHSKFAFMHPVAFIDDEPAKQKLKVMDLPILGTRKDIPEMVEKHQIDFIIIAMPSSSKDQITEIITICKTTKAQIKILPSLTNIINGTLTVNMIREVSINDLLGREPIQIDLDLIRGDMKDQVVLITGAGGSIGSEFCRQFAGFKPREMLLLGHGENSIYQIEAELRLMFPQQVVRPIIADIQDISRLENVFYHYRPTLVIHAAAHKHVPLMEENPIEAVKNNIIGTKNMVELSNKYAVSRFVMISTDKAVNPSSVMGATKRVAEMIVQTMDIRSSTVFSTVRFGNVLGSRGSVIPLFQKQIERGGPVTITHLDMVRYFMTIPEAVQLVIQANMLAKGGEIFVLDMGKPVRILDLAKDLIRLSGLEPEKDIRIIATGIRPGEKLYEELLTDEEGLMATKHNRILVGHAMNFSETELQSVLNELLRMTLSYDYATTGLQIKKLLNRLIPSYQKALFEQETVAVGAYEVTVQT